MSRAWAEVSHRVDTEIANIKDALLTAKPEAVLELQIQARCLAQIKTWFEAGAADKQRVFGAPGY